MYGLFWTPKVPRFHLWWGYSVSFTLDSQTHKLTAPKCYVSMKLFDAKKTSKLLPAKVFHYNFHQQKNKVVIMLLLVWKTAHVTKKTLLSKVGRHQPGWRHFFTERRSMAFHGREVVDHHQRGAWHRVANQFPGLGFREPSEAIGQWLVRVLLFFWVSVLKATTSKVSTSVHPRYRRCPP